jgi:hypothetical protein
LKNNLVETRLDKQIDSLKLPTDVSEAMLSFLNYETSIKDIKILEIAAYGRVLLKINGNQILVIFM